VKRREFLTYAGGAAVAWPLSASAQQADQMRRVGVLSALTADDPEGQARVAAFREALQKLGWTDGRNLQLDVRWSEGEAERLRKNAADFAALAPDVILAAGNSSIGALLQATRSVPVVFVTAADPVGAGFVDSLARPNGNATGFLAFDYSISAKWLELLNEMSPNLVRVGVLRNPAIPAAIGQFAVIQAAAPSLGVELSALNIHRHSTGRHRRLCARHEWRSDRDCECICRARSGPSNCRRRETQAADGLLRTSLCRRWRFDFLRTQLA